MPLTPADIHSISFPKAPLGNRGYDEDEVDNFLDEVERELDRHIEANSKLRKQYEQLAAGAPPGAVDNAEMMAEYDHLKRQKAEAENAARAAQAELDELRRSGGPSSSNSGEGSEQALGILMVAQRTADEHLETARSEAESMMGEARSQADELVTTARQQSESMELEAQRRHQEVMGNLEEKRSALHKHIEELKTFERQYRTRLKAYLESQLRDLTGRGEGVVDGEVSEAHSEIRGGVSGALVGSPVEPQ